MHSNIDTNYRNTRHIHSCDVGGCTDGKVHCYGKCASDSDIIIHIITNWHFRFFTLDDVCTELWWAKCLACRRMCQPDYSSRTHTLTRTLFPWSNNGISSREKRRGKNMRIRQLQHHCCARRTTNRMHNELKHDLLKCANIQTTID